MAIDSAGRIVIVGTSCNGDVLVARYLSNGSPDLSFDGDGWVCIDVGATSDDWGQDIIVLNDGRLLVGGTSAGDFALIRLNPNGSPDTTFGTGGKATYDFGGVDQLNDVALTPDGKVVMVGETTGAGCSTPPSGPTPGQTVGVAVARTTSNGVLDPSFGTGGKVVRIAESAVQRGFATAVQPNGAVVVAGRTSTCTRVSIHPLVFRLTAMGAPDPSFSPAEPLGSGSGPGSAVDVALQPDGKIVVLVDTFVGPATSPSRDDAFTVVRYSPGGSPETGFGTGGVAIVLFGEGTDATPTSMAFQGDKIVVGGSWAGDFALARFNSNGSPDLTFDGDAKVTTDFGGADAIAAIAVQPDNKIVAAGRTGTNVALARYGTSGTTTPTTPTTTTTTSTVPTTTLPTTTTTIAPSRSGSACSTLRETRSRFLADPRLRPYAPILDAYIARLCPN